MKIEKLLYKGGLKFNLNLIGLRSARAQKFQRGKISGWKSEKKRKETN